MPSNRPLKFGQRRLRHNIWCVTAGTDPDMSWCWVSNLGFLAPC